MKNSNLITLTLMKFIIILKSIILFLFSSNIVAAPLVKVAIVEPWNKGMIDIFNCEVAVPYMTAFSAEADAKLTFVLPQGSQVKKGDLVAQQDDYYLNLSLTRLKHSLTLSQHEVKYNLDEFNRLSSLKSNLVSPSVLNEFSFKHKQAVANNLILKSEIDELKYRIQSLKHFAPSNGAITELLIQPGEFLNQGDELISFVSDPDKEINCEVPITRFDSYEKIKKNRFSIDSNELRVKRINEILNSDSQFINVYLAWEGKTIPYLIGQRVKVTMATQSKVLTKLPLDAINLSTSEHYAWKVNENDEVEKIAIKIKQNLPQGFLVESELNSGDRIITLGKSGLSENQKVSLALNNDKKDSKL